MTNFMVVACSGAGPLCGIELLLLNEMVLSHSASTHTTAAKNT